MIRLGRNYTGEKKLQEVWIHGWINYRKILHIPPPNNEVKTEKIPSPLSPPLPQLLGCLFESIQQFHLYLNADAHISQVCISSIPILDQKIVILSMTFLDFKVGYLGQTYVSQPYVDCILKGHHFEYNYATKHNNSLCY